MRRPVLSALAALAVAGGVLIAPTAAYALGEQGHLLIHGPGSVYAGPDTQVSVTAAPGATASFPFEVKNTGVGESQYKLTAAIYTEYCGPNGCGAFPDTYVTYGSLQTKLASGGNGYYTPPIQPGKLAVFAFKVPLAKTIAPAQIFTGTIRLFDTSGTQLSTESVEINVTETKGRTAYDEFVTGAGQQSVGAWNYFAPTSANQYVTAPSLAVGQSSSYTVKLMNNSSAAAAIHFQVVSDNACTAFFPITVKLGSTDITSLVKNNLYVTPTLNPGQYKTLTATVKSISTLTGCGSSFSSWGAISSDGSNTQVIHLIQNSVGL